MTVRLLMFLGLLTLVSCCKFNENETFFILEDEEWSDGRLLMVNKSDSILIKELADSTKRYFPTMHNMYSEEQEDMILTSDSDWRWHIQTWPCYPIYVHRATGRVDTLYCFSSTSSHVCIGYISASKQYKDWLIMESKVPGMILKHTYLADESRRQSEVFALSLCNYTYAGQKKVFDSRKVFYWMANQHTYDIFGPLTKKELKVLMQKQNIPLPIKLKGHYDRYVYARDSSHDILMNRPKEFKWPHHRKRSDITIE